MRIVGTDGHRTVFDLVLPHGVDPVRLVRDHGYALAAPLDAVRDAAGELRLRVRLSEPTGPEPPDPEPPTERGLTLAPGEVPVARQRVAAYAWVVAAGRVLATSFSARTGAAGAWGLPGGGLDPDEQPADAVVREVHEETAQRVEVAELLTVQSQRWIGRGPDGTVEDYHAVRLIYRASCEHPTEPRVLDIGGTTAAARWVALDRLTTLRWTSGWRTFLRNHPPA